MCKKIIRVEVLDDGKLPCKAHETDAGYDLFTTEDVCLNSGVINKVPLNIKLELPPNTYAEITTKSGLGSKGMLVFAGIIDEEYRGIPHVICTSLSGSICIPKGAKIAQMILHPFGPSEIIQVDQIGEDTSRGTGGFGSSGV